MSINMYGDYTPAQLKAELLNTATGDGEQLHNALIAVCELLDKLDARLEPIEDLLSELLKPAQMAKGL